MKPQTSYKNELEIVHDESIHFEKCLSALSQEIVLEKLVDNVEILAALSNILNSRQFAEASRLREFLKYVVENTVAGKSHFLKETIVGIDVFGKTADYDPRIDPVVRTTAGRLRKKLTEFYEENPDEKIHITLPKGGYMPEFRRHSVGDKTNDSDAPIVVETENPAAQIELSPLVVEFAESFKIEPKTLTTTNHAETLRFGLMLLAACLFGIAVGWLFLKDGRQFENPNGIVPNSKVAAAQNFIETSAGQTAVAPEIDGEIDPIWAGRIRAELEKKLRGAAEINSRFGVLWDGAHLYLLIQVENNPENIVNDEIEIYLDTQNSAARGFRSHNFAFVFPANGSAARELNHRTTNIASAVKRANDFYNLEIAIPWATLATTAEAGRVIGLNVAVKHSSKSEPTYLVWSGNGENQFDSSQNGRLFLESELVSAQAVTLLADNQTNLSPNGVFRIAEDPLQNSAGISRIEFSLPKLSTKILRAKLRLFCAATSENKRGHTVKIYGEPIFNKSNQQSAFPDTFQAAISISNTPAWYEWDVTQVAQEALKKNQSKISLAASLYATENEPDWLEISNINNPNREPRLVLEY